MRDTSKYTRLLLLDSFLDGLLMPFVLPVVKFWVDQKVDAILVGYEAGAVALLTLLYYRAFDRWQRRRRTVLNDPAYVAVVSYPLVIAATILGYAPILLYAAIGVNGYFIIAMGTGSVYCFCRCNHLRYLKRRLFTQEERELFDRKADETGSVAGLGAMLLLACFALDPARLDPVTALVSCWLLSDIGLLGAFTYFYVTLDKQQGADSNIDATARTALKEM
jgi:hypothetical protein